MNKRQRVRAKTGGRYAYCGSDLPERGWHMDHVEAMWRGRDGRGGNDDEANLLPACARCNRRKSVLTPEQFRAEIAAQFDRLYRYSAGFRLAVDFGLVEQSKRPVVFFFEQVPNANSAP